MVFTNLREFCKDLEFTIRNEIDRSVPLKWNEDTITCNILSKLWNKYQSTLISKRNVMQINWQPYKFTKTQSLEQRFGDIGVLINISFSDNTQVNGVGLLEAKKINLSSRKFDSIKKKQLKRILQSAPHAFVLAYDNLETQNISDIGFASVKTRVPFARDNATTKCLVSPMNFVYESCLTDPRIYNISLPFSYQLCFRYFQGLDLEMDQKIYRDISSGTNQIREQMNDVGYPQYLMVFSVSYGESTTELHSLNPDFYEKITE